MRYPSAWDLSHVYHFEIGWEQCAMDDQEIIHLIKTRLKGRQTRYFLVPPKGRALLWPRNGLRKNATEVLLYWNQTVLQNYDFLGVTECMAESHAVMVLLWDLQPHDVVVLSSKNDPVAMTAAALTTRVRPFPRHPRHRPWCKSILPVDIPFGMSMSCSYIMSSTQVWM
jgi:hypothetical protein